MLGRRGLHWLLSGLFGLCVCVFCLVFSGPVYRAGAAEEAAAVRSAPDVATVPAQQVQFVKEAAAQAPSSGGHEAAASGEEGEGHHGLTHSQIMNFIWHCLNFTILVIVLVKYLRKPITDALNGRRESIKAAFDELESKRREAERKYAEYEKRLSGMDAEAARILKSFVEQGEAEKAKIIAQANDAAERIKAQVELYVQQELSKARDQLKKEVAELAVKMAEDLIRKNITEQDHHRLITEYLERVVTKN
ncbi:F0F1 ATP synthase subunit B [Dissulfurimicrobium hydrothermale]|uniref:F0F1 ATP synthase subunit B n=1 Tax=Dissulfurimicrobium hydrothermale TaxID=1750598 RepID=UPI001EDA71DF|nr:F0F1 ATP synthase subunit B [Dissulfurimicrobium hydrothermale]UKL13825.1 F0F1 ATP synthase subunit B [Dissulfurimicrobium hydrothermale]